MDESTSSPSEYAKRFPESANRNPVHEAALRTAHDIRKFEIELYWKRASYFWTFIAAAFAGYFLLAKDIKTAPDTVFIVACLGFVFSLAWYLVNRGSKTWQRNWEMQVDLLEDQVTGPLYKTVLNRRKERFWSLAEGYPYSPSRLNHLLNVFVVIVWAGLALRTVVNPVWATSLQRITAAISGAIAAIACIVLLSSGRTVPSNGTITPHARTRRYATPVDASDEQSTAR
jgi:hypothetical protein